VTYPPTAQVFEVLAPHRAAGQVVEWLGPCDWGGRCPCFVARDAFTPEGPVLAFERHEVEPLTPAARKVIGSW
jgi:hypothetical protein